ncbi:MAG: ribonuclease H-like domain-containing protein, partial [Candidatus Syntropharchaeia archaeon]
MEIVIDIETTGLDPFTHRIIGVGVYNVSSGTVEVKFSKDEAELIKAFWDYYLRATTV